MSVLFEPFLLVVVKSAQSIADVGWYLALISGLGISDHDICNQAFNSSDCLLAFGPALIVARFIGIQDINAFGFESLDFGLLL